MSHRIIIDVLIESPETTPEEKGRCREIVQRISKYGACTLADAFAAAVIVFRLLRR